MNFPGHLPHFHSVADWNVLKLRASRGAKGKFFHVTSLPYLLQSFRSLVPSNLILGPTRFYSMYKTNIYIYIYIYIYKPISCNFSHIIVS